MTEKFKFEDIPDFSFQDLEGSSENVLANAFIQNAGAALTEADLFTQGSYPIHHEPGMFTIYAHKTGKNEIELRTVVEDHAFDAWKAEAQLEREANEHRPKDQRCKTVVPYWVMAEMMFRFDFNPDVDSTETFQNLVWLHYPHCWVDAHSAPKR